MSINKTMSWWTGSAKFIPKDCLRLRRPASSSGLAAMFVCITQPDCLWRTTCSICIQRYKSSEALESRVMDTHLSFAWAACKSGRWMPSSSTPTVLLAPLLYITFLLNWGFSRYFNTYIRLAVFKNQIDWILLSTSSERPTQGRTLAIAQVSGGFQSFNTVNSLRILGCWVRIFTIPNQISEPKAYTEFTSETVEEGRVGSYLVGKDIG